MANAVVALDTGVLPGLAGLDMLDGNPVPRRPFLQLFTDVFWAVVYPYRPGFAASFDDPV